MLVIRMQRTGRKGHAQFRVVVQDSRRTPTSGKTVAAIGNFNPHTKTANLDKEKVQFFLDHGAQPSDRVARLLKTEGIKLPKWVKLAGDKERTVRNADKRRSTRPAEAAKDEPAEAEAAAEEPEDTSDEPASEAEVEASAEPPVDASETEAEVPTETAADTPVDEPAVEAKEKPAKE